MLFDDEVARSKSLAGELGWDTRDVLRNAGVNEEDINALIELGAAIDGRSANKRKAMATKPAGKSEVSP